MKCNVEAEVVLDNTIEDIEFDELRMTQIITNILSNAAKFSKPGDKICISTFAYENQVCFKIKDHGQGIPTEKQKSIFEKFTKFAQPHQNLPGTGLGLYVTKLLVEAHEGHITLESEVGVGTSFIVSFPRIESDMSKIQEPTHNTHVEELTQSAQ